MNLSVLRLITFDVTETLLNYRQHTGAIYTDVASKFGVFVDGPTMIKKFNIEWKKLDKEHPNYGRETGVYWEHWWKMLVKRTFKAVEPELPEVKLDQIAVELLKLYQLSCCWTYMPGAINLLTFLRSRSIPLGVISNYDPTLPRVLRTNKLDPYFNFIVYSYDIGFSKPSALIFDEALKRANIPDIEPRECLHIGNSVSLDYTGALRSGWNGIIIKNVEISEFLKEHPNIKRDNIFRNLEELHKRFLQLTR